MGSNHVDFIKGLTLSRMLYVKVVKELLAKYFPGLLYSAGLFGYGSDVLGFDNPTSTDHNWGPRMNILVDDSDSDRIAEMSTCLRRNLPSSFHGYSTHFSEKSEDNTQRMTEGGDGDINHLFTIDGIDNYFSSALGRPIAEMDLAAWVGVPEQILLELTAGEVFYDGLRKLNTYRETLAYYPVDVQMLRLAAYWDCVANEEAFIGRMVECGDTFGLRLIASRLVNYLIRICFLIRRRYAPYSKWLTSGFYRLGLSRIEILAKAVVSESDPKQMALEFADLSYAVLQLQNSSGLFPVSANQIKDYYGRPYRVVMAGEIVELLVDSIEDTGLRETNLRLVALDGKVSSLDFTEPS